MSPLGVAVALCTLLAIPTGCGARGTAADPPPAAAASSRAAAAALVERLSVEIGCDETFVARDAESTVALSVTVQGILRRARDAALPYREELAIGGPGIEVRLEQGADLDHWCSDVMERPPRIDTAWLGVAGTATIVLVERRPDDPSGGGTRPPPVAATMRLGQAVLAREGRREETLRLPALEIAATLGVPAGG
jgi:hypothetical protein